MPRAERFVTQLAIVFLFLDVLVSLGFQSKEHVTNAAPELTCHCRIFVLEQRYRVVDDVRTRMARVEM
jgi:hypothetical protein